MLEPRIRPWHTPPEVILPWNSLLALRCWHDNHSSISSCCPPISEPCDGCYPMQKAKSAGYFLLVPDWVALHQIKTLKSLINIISKNLFITLSLHSVLFFIDPHKERSFMLTQNIKSLKWDIFNFYICTASWYYQSLLFTNECTSDCLINNVKIYITIAPTCFGAVTLSSGNLSSMLAKVTLR